MLRVNQVISDQPGIGGGADQPAQPAYHSQRRQTPAPYAGDPRRQSLRYQGEEDALLAAVVEFIHTATLLHDDVVDDSDMRRGKQTASTIWGNEAAVLVG